MVERGTAVEVGSDLSWQGLVGPSSSVTERLVTVRHGEVGQSSRVWQAWPWTRGFAEERMAKTLKSSDQQWGPGKAAKKPEIFDELKDQGTSGKMRLFFGDHPHSRQDNNIYAKIGDATYAFSGNRRLEHLEFVSSNYLKSSSLSGDEIRMTGRCIIRFRDRVVYGFGYRTIEEALLTARAKLLELSEFSLNLVAGESPIGQKVYYKHVAGTVKYWYPEDGHVVIVSAHGCHFSTMSLDDPSDKFKKVEEVKADLLDPNIFWFRK